MGTEIQFEPTGERPVAFSWRGRRFNITAFAGAWSQAGRWWEGEGERRFVRVQTQQGPVADLWFDPRNGRWGLQRVHD